MAMRRLSQRERLILITCVILIVIFLGRNSLLLPLEEHLLTYDQKILVSEKQLKEDLIVLKRKQSVEEEYQRLSSFFRQKSSAEQEMASILSEIESAASDTSIHIADMKPNKVRSIDFYNHFSVTVTVEGELPSILRFIYLLQGKPHLMRADEIYLEKNLAKSNQVRCRLILSKALTPS